MEHPGEESEKAAEAASWTARGNEVIAQWKRKDWAPCGVCGSTDWYEHWSFTLCRVCLPPKSEGKEGVRDE
jgi:hypothetical protein